MNENCFYSIMGFLMGVTLTALASWVCDAVSHDVRVRECSRVSHDYQLDIPKSLFCTGFTYELGNTGGWVRVTYDVKH